LSAYQRVNLDTLVQRLSERSGPTFWTDAEKRRAINEALRVWAVMTGQWQRTFKILSVSGQIFYDVPRQIVSLQRIRYNVGTVLYPTSIPELDYGIPNWQKANAGTPQLWAPVGLDKFALYPAAGADGTNLTLEGLALTPALLKGGDFVDLGDEELNRILDYGQHYLSFKEGGSEWNATGALMSEFVQAAGLRNSRIVASALFSKYMGQHKSEEQRPPRTLDKIMGART
jgi:hypothetical protein